ncbi:HAD-IA family hydrolase [Agrococcus sp. SL85]|uniref:HAD-IA family hydrolase n=1 Tax=Agrococcus sp. SL85 TaxID=2995141 RepID=UPI00226CE5BC|nr:HAD-IA family hydrolase [Agrococcus sp. SL85]WAC66040.1 HAD-IA family hydrolase [Agrococcus sp. SL85]
MAERTEHGTGTIEVAAILFDIDGTLVDSTAAVERIWRAWGGQWGIDPASILAVSHGRRSDDTIAELVPPERRGAALRDVEAIEDAEAGDAAALPGVAALLHGLPEDAWAAVTSGRRAVMEARLAAAGLPVPRVLVAAEDVDRGKPDPQGYLLAAARLGVDAARCLVVEDAPAGVDAGLAAGATTLGVATSHPAEALGRAHAVLPDLRGLRALPDDGGLRVRLG